MKAKKKEIAELSPEESDEFTSLFVEHERALYAYVFSLVANHADAEDIVQRTFIQLWEHFSKYDPDRPFLPWAFRFAYRLVLMHRRKQGSGRVSFMDDEVIARIAEDYPLGGEWESDRQAALKDCLLHLQPDQRELIEQRYTPGVTLTSLAEEVGKTSNALYKLLQRLRAMLAECVEEKLTAERTP